MTHVHVLSISAITLILSITTVDGQPDPHVAPGSSSTRVTQVPNAGDRCTPRSCAAMVLFPLCTLRDVQIKD